MDDCKIDLLLLNIARKEHYADWNWKNVNSPFCRIYMVESGSARIIMPDGARTIRPGYLYMVPSFMTHSYENPDYFVLYYLHVYDRSNTLDMMDYPFEVKADDFDRELIARVLSINPGRELPTSNPHRYDNQEYLTNTICTTNKLRIQNAMETRGILLQLFSRFMEKASKKLTISDSRIEKAVNYIRAHIDCAIGIKELADHCGITSEHFIRLFKKEVQCTPLQYINRKKIEKAQLQMMMGNASVKDIAIGLSFTDVSYFIKIFKRTTGFSPSRYIADLYS